MVFIKTNDGHKYKISKDDIKKSQLLMEMLQDESDDSDDILDLTNITSKSFDFIIEFLQHKEPDEIMDDRYTIDIPRPLPLDLTSFYEIKSIPVWYRDFVKKLSIEDAVKLLIDANYLIITSLVELLCAYFAFFVKNKSIDEINEVLYPYIEARKKQKITENVTENVTENDT